MILVIMKNKKNQEIKAAQRIVDRQGWCVVFTWVDCVLRSLTKLVSTPGCPGWRNPPRNYHKMLELVRRLDA